MAGLSPAGKAALSYWAQIESAAANRLPTADLWGFIQDEAERRGLASPGVTVQGVNEVRSIATAMQTAREQLARANPGDAIEGSWIANAPWSREGGVRSAVSLFQVRFEHQVIDAEGQVQSEWRTVMVSQLPDTVGDLMDNLEFDALNMAADYGVEHQGIGSVQILAV